MTWFLCLNRSDLDIWVEACGCQGTSSLHPRVSNVDVDLVAGIYHTACCWEHHTQHFSCCSVTSPSWTLPRNIIHISLIYVGEDV